MDIDDKESAGKLEGDVASGRTHTQEADSLCGDPDNVGDIQSDLSPDGSSFTASDGESGLGDTGGQSCSTNPSGREAGSDHGQSGDKESADKTHRVQYRDWQEGSSFEDEDNTSRNDEDTEGGRSSAGSSSYREKLEGDRGDVIVSNEDVSMYKMPDTSSIIEKLDEGFLEEETLYLFVGGSHVRRLHDLGDNGGGRTGYLFKNGGSMEDVLFAIRCFLNSLPEKKNVSFLVWPTSSDLRLGDVTGEYYYSYAILIMSLCKEFSKKLGKVITASFLPLLYIPSEPNNHGLIDEINSLLEDATRQCGFSMYHVMSHVVVKCHEGRVGNVFVKGVEMFSPTYFWGSKRSSHIEAKFLHGIRDNLKAYMRGGFKIGNKDPAFHIERKFVRDDTVRHRQTAVMIQSSSGSRKQTEKEERGSQTGGSGLKRGQDSNDTHRVREKQARLQALSARAEKVKKALASLREHDTDITGLQGSLNRAKQNDAKRSIAKNLSSINMNK